MITYKFNLIFLEHLLGTVPKDKEIYAKYVAKKCPTVERLKEEVATVQEVEEAGWTGFMVNEDETPFLYDYVIKGYLKDACSMLRRLKGTYSHALNAHKKIIDGLIFAKPRKVEILLNGEQGVLERPLRANTAQGERVALARSDFAPAGSILSFDLVVLGRIEQGTGKSKHLVDMDKLMKEWFDYGSYRGLGQWRNAGYGSFEYECTKIDDDA
jgi:hypothetical protein